MEASHTTTDAEFYIKEVLTAHEHTPEYIKDLYKLVAGKGLVSVECLLGNKVFKVN
jgi:hypothetical protein